MKLAAFAASLAVVALAGPAHAEAPGAMAPLPPAAQRAEPQHQPLDPDHALMLSLGGTAASAALILAGALSDGNGELIGAGILSSFITPSLGHWYADDYFTWGMGMRVGGAGLALLGFAQAFSCWEDCTGNEGAGLALAGLGLFAGGVIVDIATAPRAARTWNEHNVRIAPALVSTGAHDSMGLAVTGTF